MQPFADFHPFQSREDTSIHLWIINTDGSNIPLDYYKSILSKQEQERADRFHHSEQIRRYIIAHARLREILGSYLRINPNAINYSSNSHDKPFLVVKPGQQDVQFNLSHSHEIAIIAIAQFRPVGVDVEWLKPLPDYMNIARKYFSPGEVAALTKLKSKQSEQAFIQLWAGKEALIKARGVGLSTPLNQLCLENLLRQSVIVSMEDEETGEEKSWQVYKIHLNKDYVGAIATEAKDLEIQYYRG